MASLFKRLFRRSRPVEPAGPLVVSPFQPASDAVSLDDFTVTIDTRHSRGDKLVLHLDRDGEPTLHMQVHVKQFMWLLEDPDQFAQAYSARAHWVDPYAEQPEPEPATGGLVTPSDAPLLAGESGCELRLPASAEVNA